MRLISVANGKVSEKTVSEQFLQQTEFSQIRYHHFTELWVK